MKGSKATLQRWFNKAVSGLAKQGFQRSIADNQNPWTGCLYRGDGDMKCAVGHLLRDSEVKEDVGPGDDGFTIHGRCPTERQVEFLSELQSAHDNSLLPGQMRCALRMVAENYGLTLPAVLQGDIS